MTEILNPWFKGILQMENNNMISETKKQVFKLINQSMDKKIKLSNIYLQTNNLEENLNQIEDLKNGLDSFRPLEGAAIEKLNKYFNEVYTYDSNTIEGNTLTLQETALIINKGITINGKSLREHFEVVNHIEAIEYIQDIVQSKEPFNKRTLLDIHSLILNKIDKKNAGKYRELEVKISGSQYAPPSFLKIQELMDEYFDFYEKNKNTMSPVLLSAYMHEKLVTIHPFIDGNGRTSRLIMNLILLNSGYPITNISSENVDREDYYNSLQKVQIKEDKNAFLLFIAQRVKTSLINYLENIAMNKDSSPKGEYFYNRYLELKKGKNDLT